MNIAFFWLSLLVLTWMVSLYQQTKCPTRDSFGLSSERVIRTAHYSPSLFSPIIDHFLVRKSISLTNDPLVLRFLNKTPSCRP
ncbi:hypothetical protein BJ138DRAFT_1164434 [Hygrophoropsis aurantiaca]|uniref:Uncharacterized protein n=1 Tax=Hygrophoropsis aurantiaca TaxID=72124 RepID=A0ACB7ZWY7_9AGAM|nr:hypothetical protein BJ138DRAFT_1164434 [Hygrophoropsis aurantiaca]